MSAARFNASNNNFELPQVALIKTISKFNPIGVQSEPARARTEDPKIKSLLLYQLSYGLIFKVYLESFPKYSDFTNPGKL